MCLVSVNIMIIYSNILGWENNNPLYYHDTIKKCIPFKVRWRTIQYSRLGPKRILLKYLLLDLNTSLYTDLYVPP